MMPPEMWLEVAGLLFVVFAFGTHLTATLAVVWMQRRKRPEPTSTPKVSILKPLRGIDDQLEENLETFFDVDYPDFELLFCAADPDEPALDVARRVCARHPAVPAQVVVGELDVGLNPKVRVLANVTRHARGELLMVSDSNVRVRPEWLAETVGGLTDSRIAVVSNLVAGVGERSLGASLENLQLNGFIAPAICLGMALGRPPCLVGKSMLVRRDALESVGGWEAVAHVLAEDFLLGRLLESAGYTAAISCHVVETVNELWSLGRFIERHDRWLKMRWRINAGVVTAEMAANVTAMSLLWVLFSGGAWHAVLGALGCVAGRVVLEGISSVALKGRRRTTFGGLALVPVRDLSLAALWLPARLSNRIKWREGQSLIMGRNTVLAAPDELAEGLAEATEPFPQPAHGPAAR